MKHFRTLIAAAVLVSGLTACAQLQTFEAEVKNAVSVVSTAAVTPAQAYIAINTYDAVEASATNYNRFPRCTGSNGPLCRDPAVRAQIKKLVLAGRVARNDVKAYLRANPGANLAIKSFDDLKAATSSLQAIIDQYKIG